MNALSFNYRKHWPLLVIVIFSILIGALSAFEPVSFMMAVFFGLFLLLSAWRFELCLLFVLFIYALIPQYVGFDFQGLIVINPHRAFLTGLFLVWIGRKVFSGEKLFHKTPLNGAIILFLSTRLISVIFSMDFTVSLFSFISELVTFFLFYFLVIDTIRTYRQIQKVINTLIYSGILVSLMGIVEFFSKTNLYAYLDPAREGSVPTAAKIQARTELLRIEGGFGHSIVLGMFLVFLIPLVLNRLQIDKLAKKTFVILIVFTMSLAVLFTLSRSAWIGLLMISVLFSLRYIRKSIFVVAVIFTFIVIIIAFNPLNIRTNLSQMNVIFQESVNIGGDSEVALSTSHRLNQFERAFTVAMKKPGTGYGIAKSKEATDLKSIDNYYLYLLVESGVLSVAALLFLFWLIFIRLRKVMKVSKDQRLRETAFSFWVAILSFVTILFMVALTSVFLIFWVVVALAMRLVLLSQQELPNEG